MNNIVEMVVCIIILCIGISLLIYGQTIPPILRKYYGRNPLTRLLTEEQLRSKPIYIEYAGVTIIIAGIVSLIGVLRMIE